MLFLPLPARLKVRLYYGIYTHFFNIMSEGSGLINYGQEPLCRRTAMSLPRPGRWLDVGCGVGGPARLLAAENPGVEITGINITRHQLDLARTKTAERGLSDRVQFLAGDACAMPFEKGGLFDGVYAIETAFHFPDKAAFAREVHRVLRPGGGFAMADMVVREGGMPLYMRFFHTWIGVLHMHTTQRWRLDLEAAGFCDVEVEDITEETLRKGLMLANVQIDKMRLVLEARFPRWLVNLTRWCNEAVLRDFDKQPMRYALITARRASD